MTVAAGAAKAGPYTGNDVTSSFAFSFKVFADTDIRVVETVIATEVETDLVLNTNYTVTRNNDQDNNPGGTITYKVGGVTTALPSTKKLTIVGDFDFEQPTDIPNGGSFFAQIVENALDRCTLLIKQVKERVDRAVVVDVSSADDPDDLIDSLLTAASDAEAAKTGAETAETNAGNSATAAAASASAAQLAASSALWNDVVFKTAADSPVTIGVSDTGKLFAIDCTAGAVTVNLPQISGLDLSSAWSVGIKKTDGGGNAVTVNRAGTDTIDGGTSKTVGSPDMGAVFVPDTDTAPDEWTTLEFGAVTGNLADETFTAGVDFTAGVSNSVTLTGSYGSETNITVHFDTAFQGPDTYGLSGQTLTFTSAIPGGVSKVYVKGGTTLSIGTPADGTVTAAKLADAAISDKTHSAAGKTTPVDADEVGIVDSAAGNALKRLTFANLWAWLVTKLASVSGSVAVTSASGTIGYGTGSGGTITQLTSKATAVTLNKPCGQITTHNAALAANTAVEFTFNNSLIGSADGVLPTIAGGVVSAGSYLINTRSMGSGLAVISIRNLTAGSLSEAIIINFQVIKGAVA